jgi:hypothetical protein
MKRKIPVGATIVHAYRFGFGKIATVLRTIWLPLIAQLIVCIPAAWYAARFLEAMQAQDPAAIGMLGSLFLWYGLLVFLFFVQLTAATETALGQTPPSRFYFPAGRKMWRLLGGYISGALACVAVALLVFAGVMAIAYAMDFLLAVAPGARPVVAILVGLLVAGFGYSLFYIGIRFLFLLAPINISEGVLGVSRSWRMLAGNFWRTALVILAVLLPLSIAQFIVTIFLAGMPPDTSGLDKQAADAAELTWQIALLNAYAGKWYVAAPIAGALSLAYIGIITGAQAFAYRALTEDASAPVTGDSLPDR